MLCMYFGLPGSGKTSFLAYTAALEQARIDCGISPYKQIYSNVDLNVRGVRFVSDVKSLMGKFDLSYSLLLLDEATLLFNCRKYKTFPDEVLEFFVLHRHYKCDVLLFSQRVDSTDLNIRSLFDRIYIIRKGFFFRRWSYCIRIPHGIAFTKDNEGKDTYGDIVQGYKKPHILLRLTAHRLYLPACYNSFDSFEAPELPRLRTGQYKIC